MIPDSKNKVTAIAHANIALVKYWGKRDEKLNLPAVGSISLTLQELSTETSVIFDPGLEKDTLVLNGQAAPTRQEQRVSRFLDLIRGESNVGAYANVSSQNNFPTGAGLASSASAFAALALAASRAAGLNLSGRELSILARQGSGSAARSLFGGFVEMHKGISENGSDAYAEPIAPADHWGIRLLICITEEREKAIGSTEGMKRTASTSPYYNEWVDTSPQDMVAMRQAILSRDFTAMGELAEASCLKMHGLAMSAWPGLVYWNGTTVELMQAVREFRKKGKEAYFTIDAGPQVKVLVRDEDAAFFQKELEKWPGVKRIISTTPGPDAQIVENI